MFTLGTTTLVNKNYTSQQQKKVEKQDAPLGWHNAALGWQTESPLGWQPGCNLGWQTRCHFED